MKIKRIRSEKKIATLSMVRSMTKSCLRKFGMKRTSFRILNSLKVRKTERPESPWLAPVYFWHNSIALETNNRAGGTTFILTDFKVTLG